MRVTDVWQSGSELADAEHELWDGPDSLSHETENTACGKHSSDAPTPTHTQEHTPGLRLKGGGGRECIANQY